MLKTPVGWCLQGIRGAYTQLFCLGFNYDLYGDMEVSEVVGLWTNSNYGNKMMMMMMMMMVVMVVMVMMVRWKKSCISWKRW